MKGSDALALYEELTPAMRGLRMPLFGRVSGQAKDVTRSMSALHHLATPDTGPFPRSSSRDDFAPYPSTKLGKGTFASQRLRALFRRAAVLACFAILASGCGRRGGLSPEGQAARADGSAGTAMRAVALRAEIEANDSTLIAAAERAISKGMGPLRSIEPLSEGEKANLSLVAEHALETATRVIDRDARESDAYFSSTFTPSLEKLVEQRRAVASGLERAERRERKAQQTALALGAEHRWFWLAALVAVATLLATFAIDRRHEVRRYLNGGRAKGLGLGRALVVAFAILCILTAALFFASDGLLVDLLDRRPATDAPYGAAATLRRDVEELEKRLDEQKVRIADLKTRVSDEIATVLPEDQRDALLGQWWAYWTSAANRSSYRNRLDASLARFAEERAAAEADSQAILRADESAATWRRRASRVCGLIGVVITSLVAGGAVAMARSIARRTDKLANTCPLCLAEGKLQSDGESSKGSGSGVGGMIRCKHVISESPFEECDFQFPGMFRSVPRVSFPTLGVPSAGKTHWLAMVYRELNLGNFPKDVEFAKLTSGSAGDFDRIVDDILLDKVGPRATETGPLPRPLVFNFIDQDSLGRSNVLVNVFDYSGEVLRGMTLQDHQRQRAFSADGYFFFLDPTKTTDEQSRELAGFRQDVRIVKGLKAGQQIRCPVALCVPKIDLLPGQNFARGSNLVDRFYEELRDIGWGMDLAAIQRRSNLMRRLRNDIWPNWEIERQIDDLFGGRYMFFPLSPVGMNEPGVEDLRQRTISPVGILHPMMWLLHMNGFPVLKNHD